MYELAAWSGGGELAEGRHRGKRGAQCSLSMKSWKQGLGGNGLLRMVCSSPATSPSLVPLFALTFFSSVATNPCQVLAIPIKAISMKNTPDSEFVRNNFRTKKWKNNFADNVQTGRPYNITMHYVLGLEISLSYTQILGRKRLKRTNMPGLL